MSSLAYGHNYGLMLNVDWFQPYKHVSDSIGAIYLSVMNLSREERFKSNSSLDLCLPWHMSLRTLILFFNLLSMNYKVFGKE